MTKAPKSNIASQHKPAEVFLPAEYIRDEMDARGWRVEDLAEQACWSTALTAEVLAGHHRITKFIAYGLAQAFGTSMQIWLNLQSRAEGSARRWPTPTLA